MVGEDAIGVVRKHRWATIEAQRERLKADGCRVVIDLDKMRRDWLYTAIRERTVVKAAYAFLLAERKGRSGLADFQAFMSKIAKLPRGCVGVIKDLDTGLLADSPGTRKAMVAVVREQLMRHGRGLASADNAKRGRKMLMLTELLKAKGEAIWRNVRRYPGWEDAEGALRANVHKRLTRWRAHREWGPRVGAKQEPQ